MIDSHCMRLATPKRMLVLSETYWVVRFGYNVKFYSDDSVYLRGAYSFCGAL